MRRRGVEYAGLPPSAPRLRGAGQALGSGKEEELSNEVQRCIQECDAAQQHTMLELAESPSTGGKLRDQRE